MKSSSKYIINIFAAGVLALVLLSILLFWARWLPQAVFCQYLEEPVIGISPSGLIPPEIENDPNIIRHSSVFVRANWNDLELSLLSLGIFYDLGPGLKRLDHPEASSICYFGRNKEKKTENIWNVIYFDEKLGLFVYCDIFPEMSGPKRRWTKKINLYAGPEGISKNADKTLGRFIEPIVDPVLGYPWPMPLFDLGQKRFFLIKFKEEQVVKGPDLPKDYRPIQISLLLKNHEVLGTRWHPPFRKAAEEEVKDIRKIRDTIKDRTGKELPLVAAAQVESYCSRKNILVIDKSGQIRNLDGETLQFSGPVGFLPPPPFEQCSSAKPHDSLAYNVKSFHIGRREFAGIVASSLSREGTVLAVAVFDKNGKLIRKEVPRYRGYSVSLRSGSTRAVGIQPLEEPGGLAAMVTKYILENLQPPILGLTSYFTASSFEATSGHRAMLILPNSFVGMRGGDVSENIAGRFFFDLLLMLPSIILAILLTWRVSKDAAAVGLSENAKLLWVIGTIAFGLTAYITYRLTRPKITLVTCTNCGKLRRPDMARCHRCGSKWHIPELTPPTWRVVDKQN